MRVPPAKVLSYEDLRAIVADFQRRYWPSSRIPVDVEHIADVELGLDIVSVPYLYDGYGIDGFLASNRSTIYVDQAVQEHPKLYRYRFTLAHELGHYHLHRELFEAARFDSVDDWRRFLDAMPEKSRSWYEWQGYAFAGLLLVPSEPLADRVKEAVDRARRGSFQDLDLRIEAHRDIIVEWIGRRFEVSGEVIVRRGAYDGLWER